MAYRRSDSKKNFDGRLITLRRTANYVAYKNLSIRGDVRDLVFQSVIFHLSAALEDYLTALIRNWVFLAIKHNLTSARLPESTRAYLLMFHHQQHYFNFAIARDERRLIKQLQPNEPAFALVNDHAPLPPILNGDKVLDRRKYPSPENIKVLFGRLGIDNVFDQINGMAKSNLELAYKSFVDVRTAIAHESPPTLTIADVERHLATVEVLARMIDRVLYQQVLRYSGSACW